MRGWWPLKWEEKELGCWRLELAVIQLEARATRIDADKRCHAWQGRLVDLRGELITCDTSWHRNRQEAQRRAVAMAFEELRLTAVQLLKVAVRR